MVRVRFETHNQSLSFNILRLLDLKQLRSAHRICGINVHSLTTAQCTDLPSLVSNHNLTRAIINCDVYTIRWQRRITMLVEKQELQMWPSGTKCECKAINTISNLKAHRWRRVHCNASAPDGALNFFIRSTCPAMIVIAFKAVAFR